jgi:hypothetical protein
MQQSDVSAVAVAAAVVKSQPARLIRHKALCVGRQGSEGPR